MKDTAPIDVAQRMDRLIFESRLRDLALIAESSSDERRQIINAVIAELPPGSYLLGCGPYCCGVLPLTVAEVVLGRPPSPLEVLPDTVADYTLNDAIWMVPREASRIHATIIRRKYNGATEYWLRDEASTTGTYLDGTRLEIPCENDGIPIPVRLHHGDVISLGPTGINSYLFIECS